MAGQGGAQWDQAGSIKNVFHNTDSALAMKQWEHRSTSGHSIKCYHNRAAAILRCKEIGGTVIDLITRKAVFHLEKGSLINVCD